MGYLFKQYVSDEIVEKHFKERYGENYKLEIDIQYQFEFRNKKMDVGFTKDDKAFWIFQYKKDHYMNIMEGIELKDKYTILDIYTTLMQNAVDTYKHLLGLTVMREEAKKKKND